MMLYSRDGMASVTMFAMQRLCMQCFGVVFIGAAVVKTVAGNLLLSEVRSLHPFLPFLWHPLPSLPPTLGPLRHA